MRYFSNPNFMYLQDGYYDKNQIDKFIIQAYKKDYTKVIDGNKSYTVSKEIPRIKKKIKFRNPSKKKKKKKKFKNTNILFKIKFHKPSKKKKKFKKSKNTKILFKTKRK